MNNRFDKKWIMLGGINFFLMCLGILLLDKIISLRAKNVLGTSRVNILNKEDYIFDDSEYKHFYEPTANTVYEESPEWLGYITKQTINSDSLNERFEYPVDKNDDEYRIITIGDSWTYGAYVNTGENYSEVLEDKLNNQLLCKEYNNFEVINLGVGGYDISYTVNRFMKRGLKYKPDLVVWLMNTWNILNAQELIHDEIQKNITQGIPLFDPVTQTYPAGGRASEKLREQIGIEGVYRYHMTAMKQMNNSYKEKNLIIFGFNGGFPGDMKNHDSFINDVTSLSDKYRFISIKGIGSKVLHDYHPNPEGHQFIASQILSALKETYFRDCDLKD